MRTRIYISGPMSKGDRIQNLADGLKAFRELVALGYAPLCPHLSFLIADMLPLSHGEWLAIDLPWVAVADAVLRLPGESIGADMEVAEAERCGVPVYRDVKELISQVSADTSRQHTCRPCPHTAIHDEN